ncbi:TIGR01620 family protein [Shumkonia mesophila]|uniref:TIGR01620 family protein n=1 Tax=Shumkonia mesophila TaxID=2838854 RepID=UPI0029347C4B|nr:TIGR01620 family protein [Shumkonia mesophila]
MSEQRREPFELDAGRVRPLTGEREPAADAFGLSAPLELPADVVRPHPADEPAPAELSVKPPRTRRRAFRVFLAAATGFVLSVLAIESVSYTLALFERDSVLGGLLGALAAVAFGSGLVAVGSEVVALRRQLRALGEVAELRAEAARILDAPVDTGDGGVLAARIVALYEGRPEAEGGIARFKATVTTAHADREMLSLLAREVLQPLDRQAYRVVSRAARDAGVGVLLSPAGLLDALLVIWRTSRMIRDVALVYGLRPSHIGRFALTRRVLENAAMAGAVEYLGDLLTAHIGAGVAGKVSNKVGQGAFTALRTARLGLIAIEACRPVPFTSEDRASLASLRGDIMKPFRGRDA